MLEDNAIRQVLIPLALLHLNELIGDLKKDMDSAKEIIPCKLAFGALGILYNMFIQSPTGFGLLPPEAVLAIDHLISILYLRHYAGTNMDSMLVKDENNEGVMDKKCPYFHMWQNTMNAATGEEWQGPEEKLREAKQYFQKENVTNSAASASATLQKVVVEDLVKLVDSLRNNEAKGKVEYKHFGEISMISSLVQHDYKESFSKKSKEQFDKGACLLWIQQVLKGRK